MTMYLQFNALLSIIHFRDCFGLFFLEPGVYWKQHPISELGIKSVYTLPFPNPKLWDYTRYFVVVIWIYLA